MASIASEFCFDTLQGAEKCHGSQQVAIRCLTERVPAQALYEQEQVGQTPSRL